MKKFETELKLSTEYMLGLNAADWFNQTIKERWNRYNVTPKTPLMEFYNPVMHIWEVSQVFTVTVKE